MRFVKVYLPGVCVLFAALISAVVVFGQIAARGDLMLFFAPGEGHSRVYVADPRLGEAFYMADYPYLQGFPVWSPDGGQVAFDMERGGIATYTDRLGGRSLRRLTDHPAATKPGLIRWQRIAFVSWRDANAEIYLDIASGIRAISRRIASGKSAGRLMAAGSPSSPGGMGTATSTL
jgi:TolB protein